MKHDSYHRGPKKKYFHIQTHIHTHTHYTEDYLEQPAAIIAFSKGFKGARIHREFGSFSIQCES